MLTAFAVVGGLAMAAVTPAGAGEFTIAASGARSYGIAASADRFLTVWEDSESGPSFTIRGRFIDAATGSADGESFVIADSPADEPSVASDGSQFLVVWNAPGDIRASRVSDSGEILDPGGFVIAADTSDRIVYFPSAAWDGSTWIVSWYDEARDPEAGEWGVKVDRVDAVARSVVQFTGGLYGEDPAVGADGSMTLVAWFDADCDCLVDNGFPADGAGVIYGSSLSGSGAPLYGPDSVATDGTNFLVTYGCGQDCLGPTDAGDGPRAYSIVVDGSTLQARPETRRAVSGSGSIWAVALYAGDWRIAHLELSASGRDAYVDDTPMLRSVDGLGLVAAEHTGLVIAMRGSSIVAAPFGVSAPPPTPVAQPSPSPTPTPSVPMPVFSAQQRSGATGCECVIDGVLAEGESSAPLIGALALAVAGAFVVGRRRSR